MSNDVDGVRLVRYAAQLCELLAPQAGLRYEPNLPKRKFAGGERRPVAL